MNPSVTSPNSVLQLAIALNELRGSEFDRPLGKDDSCLSSRRIIHVIQAGASSQDLEHLRTCSVCRATLTRLEGKRLESEPDFIRRAMQEAETAESITAPASAREEPRLLTAILGTGSDHVEVGPEPGGDVHLVLNLFPVFRTELLGKLDQDSLRVNGACLATRGTIAEAVDLDGDSTADYLWLSFPSSRLAPRVLEAIRHHHRVIDTIEVRGTFKDSAQELVARTSLEFRA